MQSVLAAWDGSGSAWWVTCSRALGGSGYIVTAVLGCHDVRLRCYVTTITSSGGYSYAGLQTVGQTQGHHGSPGLILMVRGASPVWWHHVGLRHLQCLHDIIVGVGCGHIVGKFSTRRYSSIFAIMQMALSNS